MTRGLRHALLDYMAPHGGKPEIRPETQLQQTIVSLVAEGLGVALVPQSLQRLGLAGAVFKPLVDAPVVEQVLVWRQAVTNPVLPHLLTLAQSIAAAIPPD